MAAWIWVDIGSGNGLLLDGTKSPPEPMLNSHYWGFYSIHMRAISHSVPQLLLCIMSLNIILLKLLPYLPRANELNKDLIIQYHWFSQRRVSYSPSSHYLTFFIPLYAELFWWNMKIFWDNTRHRSKKTSKLHVTGFCARNSSEFPTQKASNVEMCPFDDIIMTCYYFNVLIHWPVAKMLVIEVLWGNHFHLNFIEVPK